MDINVAACPSIDKINSSPNPSFELQSSTLRYFILWRCPSLGCETGVCKTDTKLDTKRPFRVFVSAEHKRQYISEIRREAVNCRWRKKRLADTKRDTNDFVSSHARSRSIKEVELEVETEATPKLHLGDPLQPPCRVIHSQPHHKPKKPGRKREWKDRATLRAEGSDRYWADRVGALYWLVKAAFLAVHPKRAIYFWSRQDALQLGQFLERRPGATLEDIRGLLINYHASDGVNRSTSAERVFEILQDYGEINPVRMAHQARRWKDKQPDFIEREVATTGSSGYWEKNAEENRRQAIAALGWEESA